MAEYSFPIPRATDNVVSAFMRDAAEILGAGQINFSMLGLQSSETLELAKFEEAAASPEFAYLSSDTYAIREANLNLSNYGLIYRRESDEEYLTDKIIISNNQRNANPPEKQPITASQTYKLHALISEKFVSGNSQSAALFRDPKAFKDLLRSHQRMVEQLQRTVTNVGEQAAAARLNLEHEYQKRTAELDREVAKKREAVEKDAADKQKALSAREAELEKLKRDLDDKSNTHARRELHKNLKARIAERASRFDITEETKRSRVPVHVAVAVTAMLLAALIVYFTAELASIPSDVGLAQFIVVAVKPLGLTLALLGIIAWYLRWLNRWFERYADAEFNLKQFELDIDRASWVVEAALEWRLSQDHPMPEHLLETISRNLFSKSEKDEGADMHPADYLASAILGKASSLNLKLPGAEVGLNNKALQKLQKED